MMPHTHTQTASKIDRLYLPYLKAFCDERDVTEDTQSPGRYLRVDPAVGSGHYWYYPIDDIMAINVADICFDTACTVSCTVPEFYCFGSYNHSMSTYFLPTTEHDSPDTSTSAKTLGYAWQSGPFSERIAAGKPLRAIAIALLPEALTRFSAHFDCDSHTLAAAIAELDGTQEIPGLDALFEDISRAQPCAMNARAVYESKISEAIALLLDWRHRRSSLPASSIRPVDRTALNLTVEYIHLHLEDPISLATLCSVACMSASKLTSLFKLAKQRTPIEFVREARLNHARELLSKSDLPLSEIASRFGFTHQGSFSEAFKARFGISPLAYRKANCSPTGNSVSTQGTSVTEILHERYASHSLSLQNQTHQSLIELP